MAELPTWYPIRDWKALNLTPVVRLRCDLDGSGNYETTELKKIVSLPVIDKIIEYTTNKPRYGIVSITISNDDFRWSDFNPNSLTKVGTRYHNRRCVLELGFDDYLNADDSQWYPLFLGFIQNKTEDLDGRQVTITLLDDWARIVDTKVTANIVGNDLFDYDAVDPDNRSLKLGTYFGNHRFIEANATDKTNQPLIPYHFNVDDTTIPTFGLQTKYQLGKLGINLFSDLLLAGEFDPYAFVVEGTFPGAYADIYVWEWKTDVSGGPAKTQWCKVVDGVGNIGFSGDINFYDTTITLAYGEGYTSTYTRNVVQYFEGTDDDDKPEPLVGCSTELQNNPSKLMYLLLKWYCGIRTEDLDASDGDTNNWDLTKDLDFEDPNYYSFDSSAYYYKMAKMSVHAQQEEAVIDVINKICELTRGSLLIDKGTDKDSSNLPIGRVRFVVLQARRVKNDIEVLTEIRNPGIRRNVADVINNVTLQYWDTTNEEAVQYNAQDSNSIAAYGEKKLEITYKPVDLCGYYDAEVWARHFADHYLYTLAEPPIRMDVATDIRGYRWDLKKLIAIQSPEYFLSYNATSVPADLTGVFEVYGWRFDTRRLEVTMDLQWAGYYLAPGALITTKRWGFWGDFTYGSDDGYFW